MKQRCGNPSNATLWRWMRAGEFPRSVPLGERLVGWYEDEIDAWVASRVRGRPRSPVAVRAHNDNGGATPAREAEEYEVLKPLIEAVRDDVLASDGRGTSPREIAAELNRREIAPPRGKRWGPQLVQEVLAQA